MLSTDVRRLVRTTALAATCAIACASAFAQTRKPDNTAVNARDRHPEAVTADQQKENLSDRKATQKIRQSLVHDKALSTYAHNVKIITRDGHVTLKGPVCSEAEKQAVEAKAVDVLGPGNVVNELSITQRKSARK